jgi:hypothetical protein
MKQKQKPLSFSLCQDNHDYIAAQVTERRKTNSRYTRSMYADDLFTHLRTKSESIKITTINPKGITSKQVADLYNDEFKDSTARQKQVLTDAQSTRIRTLIKSDLETLDSWSNLFLAIKNSKFLMGKIHSNNRKDFQLSLEWLIKPANLAKILEGAYHEQ